MTGNHRKNTQVVVEVTIVDDGRVEESRVLLDDFVRLLGDHRCFFTVLGVDLEMVRLDSNKRAITYHSCRDRERPGRSFSWSPCVGSKRRCERRGSRNRGVSSSDTQRSPRPSSTTRGTVSVLAIPRSVAYIELFCRYAIVHASDDLLSNAVGPVNKRQSNATEGIRTR